MIVPLQLIKGTSSPLFLTILDLQNGKANRTEIFIRDRALKMIRRAFAEKFSKAVFMVFHSFHLAKDNH